MKYFLLFVLLSSLYICSAQSKVRDKNTRRQIERQVYKRWNKFRPRWYFFLFHNKYKRTDRRNIKQLTPTLAALQVNKNQSQKEQESMTNYYKTHLADQANILAESHFHLHYKKKIDRLNLRFNTLLSESYTLGVSTKNTSLFIQERDMLNNYLDALRKGNIGQAESAEGMQQILDDYNDLITAMQATNKIYESANKINTLIPE